MWRVNYILPFVKKHQFDEKGKIDVVKHVLRTYKGIKLVIGKGKRTVGNDISAILSDVDIEFQADSRFIYFIDTKKTIAVPGNILSNFTLDYNKIIHSTFKKLAEKALGDDEFGQEAKAVVDGIEVLVKRIRDAIPTSNLSDRVKEKQTVFFDRMLIDQAEHFDEALQRILFFNQILWQTRHRLNGLGRLDKMLGDLYQNDVESGLLTRTNVSDMIFDFYSQLSKYASYKSDALEGDIGQITVLGGLEPDGTYFFNDLTENFLNQQAKLGKPDPKIFLRVSKNMPDNLLKTAVECLLAKTGSPLFSNDDVVIPALLDFGMPEEDAYSYCVSACWEPFIVGKSLDQNNIAVFDFFSALVEVVGRKCESFEELISEYLKANQKKFSELLIGIDQMKWAKDPLVSMFTDGCVETRKDISKGSCIYRNYGITTVAISNVVDSLMNIKSIVFDEKKHSLQEFNTIRKKNFKDEDVLYDKLKYARKSYGHDDKDVIDLVNRITGNLVEVASNYKNQFGGTVKFGLSSPGYNILSKKAKADFSGRKAGMPYNTHISCLDAPYTEVVNFASGLDYKNQRFNGNVIDYIATPEFINDNLDKFMLFMRGAIYARFFQMQMNIMDSKTLIDAKIHPVKYKGLIVRVWGFSAYFNDLPESYKDLLIERAIAAEKMV